MISTVLMLWLFGLAVVLVLRRNPNRAAWVDGVYDIIYRASFQFPSIDAKHVSKK